MEIELPDWIISDTHFGHDNISKYSQRCTPSFPTPQAIDNLMIANWHGLVRPHHTVLHLGDLGFFNDSSPDARESRMSGEFLRELPGRKLFVRGNHDDALSTEWLADRGFEEIEAPTFVFEGVRIGCSHYPQHPLPRDWQANLHGHQHNNPRRTTMNHLDMSVEMWHYAPVSGAFAAGKLVWAHNTNAKDAGPRTVSRRTGKRYRR